MRELTIIPHATIHPNKIILTSEYIFDPPRVRRASITSICRADSMIIDNFTGSTRTANGLISKLAKKKMEKALDYLLLLSNDQQVQQTQAGKKVTFKLSFITLTLSSKQIHSDNEIKNSCLNQFIIEIQKYHQVRNYIWRAEKQKNGNIHFHIVTDKFIGWSKIRDRWNRIQNKLGYVDRYRDELKAYHQGGFKVRQDLLKTWSIKNQIRAYDVGKANDYNNPNSTDIHSVKKIGNIKAYISKYVTKNPENLDKLTDEEKAKILVTGRIWSSNQELANIEGAQIDIDSYVSKELENITKHSGAKVFEGDYFKVIYIDYKDLINFGGNSLFEYFTKYLFSKFNYSTQLTL